MKKSHLQQIEGLINKVEQIIRYKEMVILKSR